MKQTRLVNKLWSDGEEPYQKESDQQEYEEETWGAKKMAPINGCRCS